MTYDSNIFENYKPMSNSKRITVANGLTVPIADQGSVTLSPLLPIQQVLNVPNLSTNLISVHQLTKDLNCRVIFSHHACEFQALDSGKMIGAVEEWNGLYYLKRDHEFTTWDKLILACSLQPASAMIEIWLQHFRLGHPPFSLLLLE